jgi:hypothetical protein
VLNEQGVFEDTACGEEEVRHFCRRKAFVKVENLCYRTAHGVADKAPRLIQGADPRFIVLCGPWFMAFQSFLKRRWCCAWFITFTSGVDTVELLSHMQKFAYYFEDDFSSFDSSIRPFWLEFEMWVFWFFGCPPLVLLLVRINITTFGVTAHGVKYNRLGMRKSGDPYTSLGNSIINACSHVFVVHEQKAVSIGQLKNNVKVCVMGDDNLGNANYEVDFKQPMSRLGLMAKLIYRDELTDCEYCSNLIVKAVYKSEEVFTFTPKPGRVLSKLGYFIRPPQVPGLIRGTALGLYAASSANPILLVLLDRLLQLDDSVPVKFFDEEWKMKYTNVQMTSDTWIVFMKRYHWSLELQALLVETLARARLGEELEDLVLEMLCDRDSNGPTSFAY